MKTLFSLLIITLICSSALAVNEGQMRLGLHSGHVGLQSDVGSRAGNAIGLGGEFGYAATEEMVLNLGYTQSSHTNYKMSDLNVGLDFYFNSYDAAYFNFSGGVDFISAEQTTPAIAATSTGFGLYAGLGADFELGKRLALGIQGQYHNAFEASYTPPGSATSFKMIQSYATVMLRVLINLNETK